MGERRERENEPSLAYRNTMHTKPLYVKYINKHTWMFVCVRSIIKGQKLDRFNDESNHTKE